MRILLTAILAASVASVDIGAQPARANRNVVEGLSPQESVAVTGCVEQDAASKAPGYKLIAKSARGTQIYRLTAPSSIDLAAELGRMVEATGTLTKRPADRGGREELDLAARSIKRVADRCE